MSANKVLAGSLTAILAVMGGGYSDSSSAQLNEINGEPFNIARPNQYVPGEFVIRLEKGVSAPMASHLASQLQAKVKKSIPQFGLILLQATSDQAVPMAMEQARKLPGVKSVFRNSVMSIPKPPEHPSSKGKDAQKKELIDQAIRQESPEALSPLGVQAAAAHNQWHLHAINWFNAGAQPPTTPMVAVIDSGVDYTHPDLVGNVVKGWDFVDEDADPMDEYGHGTHCAGIVAGTGAVNVNGVSPTTQVLAVRVLDRYNSASTFNIMAGISYAASQPDVKVMSMSFSANFYKGPEYDAYKDLIDEVYSKGILPVVSAGNDDNLGMYQYPGVRVVPAWFPNAFTVAATNKSDSRSYFSNYNVGTLGGTNWNFNFVDIAAPGSQILSTLPSSQYGELSGTSMAAPMVAGAAARYWGQAGNETKTPKDVGDQLKKTGYSLTAVYGFPTATKRLDLAKAMGAADTGFSGQVFNAQNTAPLTGVKVSAKAGGVVMASATTDNSGSFTLSGLIGGTNYSLVYAKTGYSTPAGSMKATGGTLLRMTKPVFMNQNRSADQFSVVVDWRSWEPGFLEAGYSYMKYDDPDKYSWVPFDWTQTAGTFMAPYIRSEGTSDALIERSVPGALSFHPYMKLVNDPSYRKQPVSTFVVQPQPDNTYHVYTELDNINGAYYEWGSYKTKSGYSIPNIKARIYKGGSLKANIAVQSATGTGAYWHIATIKPDGTVSPVNKLLTTAP